MRFDSGFRLFALACMLFAVAASAQGALIVFDQASFLAQIDAGYYLENYEAYTGGPQGATMDFSQGGFSYSANAPQDLWINTAIGNALSTNNAADAISFSFTSGNVTAVGGYFFPTNLSEQWINGSIVLNLSDGTNYTLVDPGTQGFVGFITSGGVLITSLTVDAPNIAANAWPTVDDFIVGAAAGGEVPEPSTFVLLALGAGALLLGRRLRRN